MIDHESHLKQVNSELKRLSAEINELNNTLAVRREQFMKYQGIAEYLTANGIKLEEEPQEVQEENNPE
jgi:hypothetical protein